MEPKPGLKTTEFWVIMMAFALTIIHGFHIEAGIINFALDKEVVQWFVIGGGGGYAISRGLAKTGGKPNA